MKGKVGITKIMSYVSFALLIVLVVGFIMIPHKVTDSKNYCFSDKQELELFQSKLEEENIKSQQLSGTTVNISREDKQKADYIYEQIFE